MELVLVMFRAEGERRSFSVPRDVTVIGRREDCDLRIPVSEVSRKHCRVIKDSDEVRVEDLGSSNGTYHNGQRIMGSVAVQPGDSIEVGPVVFVVQMDGQPGDEELAPVTAHGAAETAAAEAAVSPDDSFGELEIAPEGEGAATAAAGDSLGSYAVDSAGGEEHLTPEELAPAASHADDSQGGGAIPMADGDEPTLDLDLSDDHGTTEGGPALTEDELLLDLNLHDEPEKH